MKRCFACLMALGMILLQSEAALALSKNSEGLYVDSSGNVIDESEDEWGSHLSGYYIGEGVAYAIEGAESSAPSSSASGSASGGATGGMTVTSSDGSLSSLPEGTV